MIMPTNHGGRPPKVPTDAERKRLIDLVAGGVPQADAAACVNICAKTLSNWLARGRDDLEHDVESVYADFVSDLARARGRLHATLVLELRELKTFPAIKLALERLFPETWAPKPGGPEEISRDEYAARCREDLRGIMASVKGPPGGLRRGDPAPPADADVAP